MNTRKVLLAATLLLTAGASAGSWAETRHHDRLRAPTTVVARADDGRAHGDAHRRHGRRDLHRRHGRRWVHPPVHWHHREARRWTPRVWVPPMVGGFVIHID